MRRRGLCLLSLTLLALVACRTAELPQPAIVRHPVAADYQRGRLDAMPTYDPDSGEYWQVDLRGYDLSALDLRPSAGDLQYASFDDDTAWPPAARLPEGFDLQRILELGKNPGLGVRALHAQGITGRGVGIAIVDQVLLTGHQEYKERLRMYEEINIDQGCTAQMHGAAVASIAVGQTVGVAPEADLYYIGLWPLDSPQAGPEDVDFSYFAQGRRRILEVNRQLPREGKIRVIALQIGWGPESKGYEEIRAATEEAKAAGMLVVSSSVELVHGFRFHGLGREPLADPERWESYTPGSWWGDQFYTGEYPGERLLVPMDSRTTASPCGEEEYAFYREGGWSWSIPYIAGVYALAAQAEPGITPERFWSLAMETGRTVMVEHEGQSYPLGPILDPAALIAALG
jgi:hypothetical protein